MTDICQRRNSLQIRFVRGSHGKTGLSKTIWYILLNDSSNFSLSPEGSSSSQSSFLEPEELPFLVRLSSFCMRSKPAFHVSLSREPSTRLPLQEGTFTIDPLCQVFFVVSLLPRRDKFAKSQDAFTPSDHVKNISMNISQVKNALEATIFASNDNLLSEQSLQNCVTHLRQNTKFEQARCECDNWRDDRDEARHKWKTSEWLLTQTIHWIFARECLISGNSLLRPQSCSGDIKENCGMLMSGSSTTPCSIWQGKPACCINHCPVVSLGHLTQEGTLRSNSTV